MEAENTITTEDNAVVDPFEQLAMAAMEGEDIVPEQKAEEIKEDKPVVEEEKKEEKSAEEPSSIEFEKVELSEEYQSLEGEDKEAKINELIEKAEKEDLSPEEMTFLDNEGFDILQHEVKSEENPPENTEDNPEDKSKETQFRRPKYAETFEGIFPDRNFLTVEDYEAAVVDFIEAENETKTNLSNALEADPQAQAVFADLINGKSFRVAILDNFDSELLTKVDKDDPDYEEIIKNRVRKEDELKKQQDYRQELMKTQQKSLATADQFARNTFKKGDGQFDKDKSAKFFGEVDKIVLELNSGVLSEKTLDMFMKGLEYEGMKKAMESEASEREKNAEIRGMNRKIIIQRKARAGGGTPNPQAPQNKVQEGGRKFSNAEEKLLWLADNMK